MTNDQIIKQLRSCINGITIIPTKDDHNSIGVSYNVVAEVFPTTTDHVVKLIKFARNNKIPLYPISRGLNTGYGDKSPWRSKHILINMCKMNKIISFDNEIGIVRIQPGVTQSQLFEYLKKHNSNYWMDVTGAGEDASIMGNILDGGFGHTPLGYKRKNCSNFEVVLGTSEIINTDQFPAMGPDLSSLFIQSNFGIVTAIDLELFIKTDQVEMVIFSTKQENDFSILMGAVQKLRQQDIINNLTHIYNPLRLLISLGISNLEHNDDISNDDAYILLKKHMKGLGYWNCSGAVYGTKTECRLKRKEIRKIIGKRIKVQFFSERKINLLNRIVECKIFRRLVLLKKIRQGLYNLSNARMVFEGKPFDGGVKKNHLSWRQQTIDDGGLIWYAPTFKTNAKEIYIFYKTAESLFKKEGYDFPITMTLVTKHRTTAIISIHYNKNNKQETQKAINFYQKLEKHFANKGINPYRCPIVSNLEPLKKSNRYNALQNIKHAFDPDNIIAQNRYIEN